MTTPHSLTADPSQIDQSELTQTLLDNWIDADPEAQDESLARLIAASIHDGAGSALERFAATGLLDAEAALSELNDVRVPWEREAWVDALGRYIIAGESRQ
ncbi:hypothetical protein M4I32_02360 [Microbacterium sp. LRZ72]|uniref:hypothetical protein n=1 Tax=Microbacterium sp. LRZ72 TaxID=2942481 RepID=UPI0029B6AA41|nr:hypothetical protein [Microbacterium sp. LRZ72]MDX2375640.1 hypothetical protein [Microbacterium sp. LRZ72]